LLLVNNAPSHFDPYYHLPEFEQDEDNVNEELSSTSARGRSRAGMSRSARGTLLKSSCKYYSKMEFIN